MNEAKKVALEALDELHPSIDYSVYCTIHDGLTDIEMLRDRDEQLEELWAQFADVPMNPETECIEEQFLGWGAGIHREEIWHWFDRRHSKGIAYLLYGRTEDYVSETKRLYAIKQLCIECDAEQCVFNPKGICLAPFVTGREPKWDDHVGCKDFCYKEIDDEDDG